jgi:hypothetical protein
LQIQNTKRISGKAQSWLGYAWFAHVELGVEKALGITKEDIGNKNYG